MGHSTEVFGVAILWDEPWETIAQEEGIYQFEYFLITCHAMEATR